LLILERAQKKWFWSFLILTVLSVGLYLVCYRLSPGGLTGGDLVGMWYGLAGFALMLYAAALSLLRWVPSWWWLGARKTWLRGHVWLGSLSGVLLFCHSGGRFGGPFEQVLMVLLLLTLGTGIAGLLLQQVLPRLITSRIACEAPYEQIPRLCASLRQDADTLIELLRPDGKVAPQALERLEEFKPAPGKEPARVTPEAFVSLAEDYAREVRPFLAQRYDPRSTLAQPARAQALFARLRAHPGLEAAAPHLDRLEVFCAERRQLALQERLHLWLHGWLLLHVPLAVALLVLGLVHAFSVLYY
jgi:hypothetical protein